MHPCALLLFPLMKHGQPQGGEIQRKLGWKLGLQGREPGTKPELAFGANSLKGPPWSTPGLQGALSCQDGTWKGGVVWPGWDPGDPGDPAPLLARPHPYPGDGQSRGSTLGRSLASSCAESMDLDLSLIHI